jgi:hypothetical protein
LRSGQRGPPVVGVEREDRSRQKRAVEAVGAGSQVIEHGRPGFGFDDESRVAFLRPVGPRMVMRMRSFRTAELAKQEEFGQGEVLAIAVPRE